MSDVVFSGAHAFRLWPFLLAALVVACGAGSRNGGESGSVTTTGSVPVTAVVPQGAPRVEGWLTDWTKSSIDLSELIRGIDSSDPRDVIAPLDEPKFETVAGASSWL